MRALAVGGLQPFGFAGGLWDRETGLVRFGARDDDPRSARWTAGDPLLFCRRRTTIVMDRAIPAWRFWNDDPEPILRFGTLRVVQ